MRRFAIVLAFAACHRGHDDSGGDGQAGDSSGAGDSSSGATTGSSSTDGSTTGEPDESPVDEARRMLPTYLDLHDVVISRTCTPNDGVCHNDKEYPDLHTPQAMLGAVGSQCNLVVKDPIETFDGCEVVGDQVTFLYGLNDGFISELAFVDTDADTGAVVLTLRDDIPNDMYDPNQPENIRLSREYDDGEATLVELYGVTKFNAGHREIVLVGLADYGPELFEILDDLRGGDPNRNGTFGADSPGFTMITPGDPSSSYLLGRVQGIVPGTPMPLANQPLSSAEMIALTCWIEGLGGDGALDVNAPIDYDDCQAALTFGQPDPTSGHSFATDVQPIFATYCAAGGCHAGEVPASDLDLSPEVAYENLRARASQDPETPRVEPGNPTNSYLMIKLRGKGLTGLQMPRNQTGEGVALPDAELATIERWIVAGAPND